eukprot:m.21845 g.21845  ORF g.21845 m.21845 type:complete len:111 (-) comp5393_c1_seq1:1217-1549(-)
MITVAMVRLLPLQPSLRTEAFIVGIAIVAPLPRLVELIGIELASSISISFDRFQKKRSTGDEDCVRSALGDTASRGESRGENFGEGSMRGDMTVSSAIFIWSKWCGGSGV